VEAEELGNHPTPPRFALGIRGIILKRKRLWALLMLQGILWTSVWAILKRLGVNNLLLPRRADSLKDYMVPANFVLAFLNAIAVLWLEEEREEED
jgi:hypothetical protein